MDFYIESDQILTYQIFEVYRSLAARPWGHVWRVVDRSYTIVSWGVGPLMSDIVTSLHC